MKIKVKQIGIDGYYNYDKLIDTIEKKYPEYELIQIVEAKNTIIGGYMSGEQTARDVTYFTVLLKELLK
jgi:hypothetical protein